MNWPLLFFVAHVFSTCYLLGLIWTVQSVHYPLFDDVGEGNYVRYQRRHQNRITFIVGPVMLIELVTAVLILLFPPEGIIALHGYIGAVLVGVIWLSTALIQVPCHARLSAGFDRPTFLWLVNSNWIRTCSWTARAGLVTWMLVCVLSK